MCHHYLVPLLTQIPLDASLLKRDSTPGGHSAMGPPETLQEKSGDENGESSKDISDPLRVMQVDHELSKGRMKY